MRVLWIGAFVAIVVGIIAWPKYVESRAQQRELALLNAAFGASDMYGRPKIAEPHRAIFVIKHPERDWYTGTFLQGTGQMIIAKAARAMWIAAYRHEHGDDYPDDLGVTLVDPHGRTLARE